MFVVTSETELSKAVEHVMSGIQQGVYEARKRGAMVQLPEAVQFTGRLVITPNGNYLQSLQVNPEVTQTSDTVNPNVTTEDTQVMPDRVTSTRDERGKQTEEATEAQPKVVTTREDSGRVEGGTTIHPSVSSAQNDGGSDTSTTTKEYEEL